jgi:hypothetical protein
MCQGESQQIALRVNEGMSLAPPDFFPHIEAPFGTANGTGFDRLAVDDGGTGLSMAALLFANLHAQGLQDLIPDPFAGPSPKVVIDGAPGRKLMGQQSPRAPTAQDVEDGIDQLASRVDGGPAIEGS